MSTFKSKKIKTKKNMSNLDLLIISRELNEELEGGFIDNIYEINDSLLLIKCRTKQGKRNLILDASKRINFTNYSYPIPPSPSQYCSVLRKYMKGRRILKVYQYGLDRILVFDLYNKEGDPWKFIIELFLGGNFILVDDSNKTFMAKHYKIVKGRKILAKKEYIFPEKRGHDFMEILKEDFVEIIKNSDLDLVRTLSRNVSLPGYLSEEICSRAQVDKNISCEKLNKKEIDILFEKITEIRDFINKKITTSRIYTDSDGNYMAYEPFEHEKYSLFNIKNYDSYNEAMDDYYAKIDSDLLKADDLRASNKILNKYQRIHDAQVQQIKESEEKRKDHLDMGNIIYQYFDQIDLLLKTVLNARKNGMDWKEITTRLEKGKEKGINEAIIFDQIYPKEAKIGVKLDDQKIKLDFRKTVVENANEIYKQAKKDKRRIEGANLAIEKTKKTIKEKQFQKELSEQRKTTLIKRPKKKWHEKFRWFISSDGFLIVGGKDASSNEVIVKKYMDNNDLFFHTELRGAACVILKNPDKIEIPELTLKEVSTFAASYSNAWREGWGSTKIFHVNPDQVTKSPNPGEFLKKGAFFIKGNKNFLPKPFLELAVGLILESVGEMERDDDIIDNKLNIDESLKEKINSEEKEDKTIYFPRIIAGPLSSIKSKTDNFVRIKPQKSSKLGGGKLAEKIKTILIEKTPNNLKKWAKEISNNDVMHFLPPGGSSIVKKK